MKKLLLVLSLLVVSFSLFSQTKRIGNELTIDNELDTFTRNASIGTVILDETAKKWYRITAFTPFGTTLSAATKDEIGSPPDGNGIYSSNDSIPVDRTVFMNGNDLSFIPTTGFFEIGTLALAPVAALNLSVEKAINTEDSYYIDNVKFLHKDGGISVGDNGLVAITTGTLNNNFGEAGLFKITTGIRNAAFGHNSFIALNGAKQSFNVGMGFSVGADLVSGNSNAFFGSMSGFNVDGGDNNVTLGANSGATVGATYNNSVAIGTGARFNGDNQVVFGSDGSPSNEFYFGQGIFRDLTIDATEIEFRITSITDGVNTDISPDLNWGWYAPPGTGTGIGGSHIWYSAPAGTTGSTQNSSVEAMRITGEGNIGVGIATPNASALLHLSSITQGFLKPTLTTAEKNAIVLPATGLEVYDSTLNVPVYYDGESWIQLAKAQLNEQIIYTEADFDTTASGDIDIKDGINYTLGASIVVVSRSMNLTSIAAIAGLKMGLNRLIYTGSDYLYKGNPTGAFITEDGLVIGNRNAKIWNVKGTYNPAGSILVSDKTTYTSFGGGGIIDSIGAINYISTQHANDSLGTVFTNIGIMGYDNNPQNNTVTDSKSPYIVLDGSFLSVKITGTPFTVNANESAIQISSNFTVSGSATINGNQFSDDAGGEFLASAKSNTTDTIVDNGSGDVRINTSINHGLTIEQVIVLTNNSLHNGTHNILAVIDSNTYDLNLTFAGADTTDWTTGNSNDFLDNNDFSFVTNGDQPNTDEICTFHSDTIIPIVIPATDSIICVVGDSLNWTGDIERRYFVQFPGDSSGTARYTGEKLLPFKIAARVSVDVAGGAAKIMSAYITIDGVPQLESIFTGESANLVTLHPELLINLSEGAVIGVGVENNDDTSDIEVIKVNIIITKAGFGIPGILLILVFAGGYINKKNYKQAA